VQGGAKRRHHAEARSVLLAVARDDVADDERAGEAVAVGQRSIDWPGQDRLVANVLVDLGVAFQRRVGDVAQEPVQQLVEADRPEPLGKPRRVAHIDQQEHALLAPRLDVAPGQQVLERAESQQPADLDDQVADQGHRHGEDERAAEDRVEADLSIRGPRRNPARHDQAEDDHDEIEGDLDDEVESERQTAQPAQSGATGAPCLDDADRRGDQQRGQHAEQDRAHGVLVVGRDGEAEIAADHGAGQADPQHDPPFAALASRELHAARRPSARVKVA